MRIIERMGFFYKILFIEAGIIFLVGAIFYGQFSRAKADVIKESVAASELIGNEATEFVLHRENATSSEFNSFLRRKHGQNGVFKSFSVQPVSFNVMFMKENRDARPEGFYSDGGYGARDEGGIFSVAVPFLAGTGETPYGVVTINSSKRLVMRKVFEHNFLLYLALFVVLNNQVFILRYFSSRRQKDIIDKNYARPYMKQHSIGALKVMRKILDEIVEDHHEEPYKGDPKTNAPRTGKKPDSQKIISISTFLSKTSKE